MFHEERCPYAESPPTVSNSHDKLSAAQVSMSADTMKHTRIESKHVAAYRGVWCGDGTHYVRVGVSHYLGPDSTTQQVDEDKIFTVEQFRQTDFSRTELYEHTAKKIIEFNRRCCRSVQDTTTARIPEQSSSNARNNAAQPNYDRLCERLQCVFPCISTQRKSGSRNFPAQPSGSYLPPIPHPSTETINAGDRYRSSIDITTYCESCESSDSK